MAVLPAGLAGSIILALRSNGQCFENLAAALLIFAEKLKPYSLGHDEIYASCQIIVKCSLLIKDTNKGFTATYSFHLNL